ncbi:hypothetical protein BT96DRAFT_849139 [Gymnopus androsaceus JB14]|uniref:Transferase family protein n=1 Tax=Gymnopus androsaceus JB14 TaxID=1447944 RepID=A0A6A4I8Z1_9AGAR|nr:hypothetical protein BT96DRAFT_849139 [Gymnopus androsaceus JB14]
MSLPKQTQPVIAATVTRRTRVFPFTKPRNAVHSTKALSIVDGTVLRYSATRAVWFFDAPSHLPPVDLESLCLSLRKTLDFYPQWAGSLHMPIPNVVSNSLRHTQRFNRPQLTWGAPEDPGVEFIEAQSQHFLSMLPTPAERADVHRIWDASLVTSLGTLSDIPKLALHDRVSSDGLPCMIVQVTTFLCGGVAIAVKLAHPLADAQTLLTFIHDFARIHRGLVDPAPSRDFAPELLDKAAEGDIDAPLPDPDIIARSKNIPLHRYDWWASATPDCPSYMLPETVIPPQVTLTGLELGTPLPWKSWDIMAPIRYYRVYFTHSEIMAMWKAAIVAGGAGGPRISKLDALLAHIWTLIVRARHLSLDESPNNLDVSLGLRARLSPSLHPHFLGSPLLNTPVTQPASQVSIASATIIRSSMAMYGSFALGALLHEMAYTVDPSRQWNTFLGERHTIVTSWLENRRGMTVYDVDFGFGSKPRMVDPLFFECDGCVQIMESGLESRPEEESRIPWYNNGVSVGLHFREDVMQNLLADPWLRKYCTQIT